MDTSGTQAQSSSINKAWFRVFAVLIGLQSLPWLIIVISSFVKPSYGGMAVVVTLPLITLQLTGFVLLIIWRNKVGFYLTSVGYLLPAVVFMLLGREFSNIHFSVSFGLIIDALNLNKNSYYYILNIFSAFVGILLLIFTIFSGFMAFRRAGWWSRKEK